MSTSPQARRIVFAGFQHETNTFAPSQATIHSFEHGGGWPALSRGEAVFTSIKGKNIPASGFVEQAKQAGYTLIPVLWCAAIPSAHVQEAAYEQIAGEILEGIRQALPVDGVYLDLHGAMVTTHLDDGEGELIRRVRNLVGPDTPIVVSLDFHANVTELMLSQADGISAFRTYPHVDMAKTGERAFDLLEKRWAFGQKLPMAVRRLPYIVAVCWQCTDLQPASRLYALLEQLEADNPVDMSFTMGFPADDFPECGAVIWGYAEQMPVIEKAVTTLEQAALEAESEFAGKLYDADEAVAYAIAASADSSKPVVIADAQDNPGSGGDSDTTAVLRALVEQNAQNAALGLLADPAAMKIIATHKPGDTVHLSLGGHSGVEGDAPYENDFVIESLSDGKIDAVGPYYKGYKLDIGPSACLRIGGVRIAVCTYKVQMADRALFRVVGIEPTEKAILVVKSAVHFRADFTPIASEIIVAAAPGAALMRLELMPWTRLATGMRLGANGIPFSPASIS